MYSNVLEVVCGDIWDGILECLDIAVMWFQTNILETTDQVR